VLRIQNSVGEAQTSTSSWRLQACLHFPRGVAPLGHGSSAALGRAWGGHGGIQHVGQIIRNMTSPTSTTLGNFAAPAALPIAEFDAVNERVSRRSSGNGDVWHGFASAWNGVAYRLRAALEHEVAFTASLSRSSAPPPDERYGQDHDLFGFVVSAVSAVECFHFAAYCMAALVDPAGFPLTQSKNLKFYPTDVRGRYQRVFPAETLTRVMTSTLAAPECDQLTKLRNVLAHRGTPPRMTFSAPRVPILRPRSRATWRVLPPNGAMIFNYSLCALIRIGRGSKAQSRSWWCMPPPSQRGVFERRRRRQMCLPAQQAGRADA
jgi:hypothetical protein